MRLGSEGELFHPLIDGKSGLGLAHGRQVRVRLGVARHEERATIRRVLRRDRERPQLLRLRNDFKLVGADERAEHRKRDSVIRRPDVVERLRGDLPKALPRDDGLRMLVESDAFSDAEHKTAIQDNPQLRWRRKGNLALVVTKGHNIDARDATRFLEHMRDVVDQELGGIRRLRPAREMYADADSTTARNAPERHRRVDSRGKQAYHRARASNGKAPDARDAARVDIRRVLHNFDPHRKVGVLHLDFYLRIRLTQTPADNLVDLHRVHGEIGVVAARVYLEARKRPRLAHREDARLGHLVEVALALEPA